MARSAIVKLDRRIESIKKEIVALGPLRPGSISEQYNVCGTPGCRCKDPKNPKKHGPYYRVSYTWRGGNRTEFLKDDSVSEVRQELETHKRLKDLVAEWVDLSVEIARAKKALTK